MECHKCEYGKRVRAGRCRGVRWERTPCSRCELRQRSEFTMEFDEERSPGTEGRPYDALEAAEAWSAEEVLPVTVLREVVAVLLSLDPVALGDVCRRYQGMMYREIGAARGVTGAAVEMRHKRLLRRCPALQAMFGEKVAKQGRRRRGEGRLVAAG